VSGTTVMAMTTASLRMQLMRGGVIFDHADKLRTRELLLRQYKYPLKSYPQNVPVFSVTRYDVQAVSVVIFKKFELLNSKVKQQRY